MSHPILDDISKWGSLTSWAAPDFNVKAFQKRIDDIVGKNRDGKSIVVLRWMRSRECYEEHYTKWDSAGQPTETVFRAKYRAFGIDLGDGNLLEIPPPRWVLEQRYEPEQLALSWETDRWITNDDGKKVPVKGGLPREGYYSHLWTIASHDSKCCKEAEEVASVCWGQYRLPMEKDLEVLRRAVRRRDEDTVEGNPYGEIDVDSQIELQRRVKEQIRSQAETKSELIKDILQDSMRPHLHRLTDDPSVLKHGKYHFTKEKKK